MGIKSNTKTLEIDVKLYEKYLQDKNLTEDQRNEFLNTLWSLVCEFVYLGYGVTSTEQALQAGCGKDHNLSTMLANTTVDRVESTDQNNISDEFNRVANADKTRQE